MKLLYTLLLSVAAWAEKGRAIPCEDLLNNVAACLGDEEGECRACVRLDPKHMDDMDPGLMVHHIHDKLAKCSGDGQPCGSCAVQLKTYTDCSIMVIQHNGEEYEGKKETEHPIYAKNLRINAKGHAITNHAVMAAIEQIGSAVQESPTPLEVRVHEGGTGDCDTLTDVEWHLKFSKIIEAWEYSQLKDKPDQGKGILIASPDTGYYFHPFTNTYGNFTDELFQSKGHNWISNEDENDALDRVDDTLSLSGGHGTQVSAIMAGRGTHADKHGFKIRGVAPKAKVLPLRVTSVVWMVDLGKMREAIVYAKDNGAHIVSSALGTVQPGLLVWKWKQAVDDAIRNNMILVTAGGQWVEEFMGANQILPASYHNFIAVSAVDANKTFWGEGLTGDDLAFAAAGVDVCTTLVQGGKDRETGKGYGTSYATAITAGAAALWLAHHGREGLIQIARSRDEYLQHLFCKAVEATVETPAGWNEDHYGAGILDAKALLMLSPEDLSNLPSGDTRHCKIDVSRLPNGKGCIDDEDCQSGRCDLRFKCNDLLGKGETCWNNDDCLSGVCAWKTGRFSIVKRCD